VGHASGLPDLVALHSDPTSARTTIERLSRAGIDGGAIEMIGSTEVVTAGRYGDRQTDLGSTLHLGGRILRGIAWGLVPGALFGALLLGLATTPTVAILAAGAGGGALFGASVGALTGLLAVPSMVSSWERTFSPHVPGGIAIGIRIERPRTDRRARRTLVGCATVAVVEVPDLDDLPSGPFDPSAAGRDG
jgi:hypothetical protein